MYSSQTKTYILILKCTLLGFVFYNACQIYGGSVFLLSVFAVSVFLLAANDAVRKFSTGLRIQTASLVLSIAGAALLKYFVPGIGAAVYIFIPLFELFDLKANRMKILLCVQAASYFTVLFIANYPFNAEKTADAGTATLLYMGVACMSWLLHANWREKEEVIKLNEELSESNQKLIQYTRQVEELTITAERSRVAQELHDSLGHSLMALSMHLDYAEKIFDAKPDEAKAVLAKTKNLSKKSAEDLRGAVDALKAIEPSQDLNNSIEELVRNFASLENVQVDSEIDGALENANAEVKNCIYKAVREGLTNGLKHGKATFFTVRAQLLDGAVFLRICDNGVGCARVIESTGLAGIRSRVEALGGSVAYDGGVGFTITAEIPVPKEDMPND